MPFIVVSNIPCVTIGHTPLNDPGSQLDVLPTIMYFFNRGSCTNSPPSGSRLRIRAKKTQKDCSWVAEDVVGRCGSKNINATCPRTCASCDGCTDSPLTFMIAGYKSKRFVKCSWTKKNLDRCEIDGMRDTCRKTCGSCIPYYDVDGKVFGFVNNQRPPKPEKLPCKSDPETCGCEDKLQNDYRGTVNTTVNGRMCQRWYSQSPHTHSRTSENYPSSVLTNNYYRNPDGEPGGAWCYTTDEDERRKYCFVPRCKGVIKSSTYTDET